MSLEIQQFQFKGQYPLRVIDRDGEPWFYASDACRALALVNVSDSVERLDDDEKDDIVSSDTIGRSQRMLIVNEPGLYTLIMRSDKPEAKAFKRWVTHEVLPAIRKTGAYLPATMTPTEALLAVVQRMVDTERTLTDHEQRLADVETRQTAMENGSEYYSIVGFASRIGRRVTNESALALGKYAGRYSRKHGYPIGEAPDPRYGKVNTYHINVLESVFGVKS
jgi:anti-repressor protein